MRNSAYNAFYQISLMFGCITFAFDLAKTKRIHTSFDSCTHCENIAKYAAHASSRTLKWLDKAWVIVAFHFKNRSISISDVDNSGIFARTLYYPRSTNRKSS